MVLRHQKTTSKEATVLLSDGSMKRWCNEEDVMSLTVRVSFPRQLGRAS